MSYASKIAMIALLGALLVPAFADAQEPGSGAGITPTPPLAPGTSVVQIAANVVTWAFGLLLVLAVIFIVWAAFLYLTSGGDDTRVAAAKKYLTAAIWAVVIAALARVIVAIIRFLLGV